MYVYNYICYMLKYTIFIEKYKPVTSKGSWWWKTPSDHSVISPENAHILSSKRIWIYHETIRIYSLELWLYIWLRKSVNLGSNTIDWMVAFKHMFFSHLYENLKVILKFILKVIHFHLDLRKTFITLV